MPNTLAISIMVTYLPYLFGSFVYALVKILILHESNNKMRIFLGTVAENGNGCENGCGKKMLFS